MINVKTHLDEYEFESCSHSGHSYSYFWSDICPVPAVFLSFYFHLYLWGFVLYLENETHIPSVSALLAETCQDPPVTSCMMTTLFVFLRGFF